MKRGRFAFQFRFRDCRGGKLRKHHMGISLKLQHLNRYRQIAWIFMKYGRSDLVKESELAETLEAEQRVAPAEAAKANEMADDLESSARLS